MLIHEPDRLCTDVLECETHIAITLIYLLREFAGVQSKLAAVLVAVLLLTIAAPMSSSQGGSSTPSCSSSNTFTVTTSPLPNSFNLLTAAVFSPFVVAHVMWNSLDSYTPVPNGANGAMDQSYSVTDWVHHNADYTQWTFNVRQGLTWSNGSPVNASDVLATYSASYGLNPLYDVENLHSEVTSASALNSTAVVFNLNKSDAQLPLEMSSLLYDVIMPGEAISQGPGSNLFGTNVVDGPFYSTNYTSGSPQLVMYRNPYYTPQPNICELVFNFVESNTQQTEFLVSGKTDIAGPLDPSNLPALAGYHNIHLMDQKASEITTMWYNVTSYPYNTTAFRQALAYGINSSQIVQQAFNGFATANSNSMGIVPSNYAAYNPAVKKYSYDPTTALSLLSTMGIKMGSDGHLQYSNGTDVSLTIWTDSDNTYDVATSSIVQTELQSLGFQVSLQVTKLGNILGNDIQNLQGVRHDIMIFTSGGPYFANTWLDAQPGWSVYSFALIPNSHWEMPISADAQYQSNLTALDATANLSAQAHYLNNIQLLNSQFLPVIPLAYPDYVFAYNTQHWTNWPTNGYFFETEYVNQTLLATLQPVSSSSTTTTTTLSSSTASSSGASAGLGFDMVAAALVVAVVVIVILGVVLVRRRPRATT